MKALLVLTLMVLAAATALAYGRGEAAAGVNAIVGRGSPTEPIVLLLSGTVLLGLAGAVKRLTV
jgi:hypothetical protein